MMWSDSEALVDVIAPDQPVDADPLTDSEMLVLLEQVAAKLPVTFWDDPDALDDLARLRMAAFGEEQPQLKSLAKRQRALSKAIPDPSIAPGSPEWDAQEKRLKRG